MADRFGAQWFQPACRRLSLYEDVQPTPWLTITKFFAATLAIWCLAAFIFASKGYDTVLSCDRIADICTVAEVNDLWSHERDRFRPSDYLSIKIDPNDSERRIRGCVTLTLSRAEAVSICEAGATRPDFAWGVQHYFADREQVRLQAVLSNRVSGYLAIAFFGALSLLSLVCGMLGLWTRIRPRKPALPTGREGIGSRR